ncbi:MAG: bifunctional DNA primase/polymerase [Acidobacteria bacterium]|nr:bifunctional DNA primase/polymerase [Acidobacteriota bacterium]
MTILDHALDMWRREISVIPVPRPDGRHDGKVPAIAWKEYQTRRPTEDELRAWFRGAPMNLAIVTGAISNLVVVDPDSREGLRWCVRHLPYTPWQVRTARGFHLYFRHPGVPVRNRAKLETPNGTIAVDVRGDGGYVIGPGSVHASGHVYQIAGDWTREDVPRFWPGWLARPERPARPAPVYSSQWRPSGDVAERARRYLAQMPRPEIGHGSDVATLTAACRLVRGFALDDATAEALLWEWAGGRPGWTREWVARKVQHARRYGTEPIGGLVS